MSEFKETQRFNQWWLWVILIALVIIPVYGLIQQVVFDQPFGTKPMSDIGLYAFLFFSLCIAALLFGLQLKTTINATEIVLFYRPFINKRLKWYEIDRLEIIKYGFVGYGMRYSLKHGTIYNVSGQIGVKIFLKNGKHFIIGTQKPKELKQVLERLNKIKP